MTATVEAMYAVARRDPYGRAALALVWLGVLVVTCGLAQLHIYLRRHPLIETPAVWSEPAPASSTSAGAGRHFHPYSPSGGAAPVVGPVIHSTTPAVDGERAVFRGSAP
ncbi:hypothetical protein M3G91_33825 [Micromonospora chalcea]|uniref:hypothetical protein n=1 Tax=Micromonospora chalcea TaxID=1874 RepID=UPI0021A63365|nr:hypothetical protein [Micromonospora chalcea]MCT2282591.1 hypothetical protein [Micromonospora chalcea]